MTPTRPTRWSRRSRARRSRRRSATEVAGYRGWSPPERTGHHARAGAPRRDVPHRRQALLRWAGQQQPRPHRRGPRPGARGRRVAGAAGRRRRGRGRPRPYAVRASPPRSSPSGSASTSVEEPGFAEMEFGAWDGLTFAEVARALPRRDRGLARVPRRGAERRRVVPRGREARPGRAGAGPRRLRRQDGPRGQPRHADQDRSSPTPSTRRCRRCSGWSSRPRR